MHLPLSFIVFGVPRSGTKGLARALNLHPEVLCAIERFDHKADHSQVTFPESFVDGPPVMARNQRRKLQLVRAEIAQKPGIEHAGNKFPRYYLALERINAEVPGLRNLLIYRSPEGFMPSWNRKESTGAAGWYAGQVGLFGLLDLLVCLQRAVRQPRLFVFPYSLGLNESVEPLQAAIEFIGADPAQLDVETFASEHLPRRVRSKRRWTLPPHERKLLDRLRVDELDHLLDSRWGTLTPQLVTGISDYLRSIAPVLPGAIDEAAACYDNPAMVPYGRRYLAANRDALREPLELLRGSRFVAELERGGSLQTLRWAYVQRRVLTRRLRSVRRTAAP